MSSFLYRNANFSLRSSLDWTSLSYEKEFLFSLFYIVQQTDNLQAFLSSIPWESQVSYFAFNDIEIGLHKQKISHVGVVEKMIAWF